MSLRFWQRSCPVATLPIEYNAQGIVRSLTENNLRKVWACRGIGEDEQLYLVHVLGIAGIGLPTTLVVKKFQNVNPALQVDDNVKNRCKSEMFLLASICHDNIIKILDVIMRTEAIMLVYKYEVNGSLHHWLHQPMDVGQPLSWPKRSAIAIGVAKGLCHLHHGCNKPIVHHNISSDNILLDQNFKAVIASFGAAQMNMAGLNQPLPITDLPPGNFGYAAPGSLLWLCSFSASLADWNCTERPKSSGECLQPAVVSMIMPYLSCFDGHYERYVWFVRLAGCT